MGFWAVVAFVISSQVGSGIFLFPHTLAPYGNLTFVAWGVAGVGAMALAFLFSGLCHRYPRTGGPHVYVTEGLGRTAGFYTAWSYWVLAWLSSAPLLAMIAGSICVLFGWSQHAILVLVLEGIVLAGLTWLNLRGVEASGRWELAMTLVKMVPLVVLPLGALFYLNPEHFTAWNPSGQGAWVSLSSASVAVLWGFLGVEAVTAPAGSIEKPERTIPRAIFWGTLAVLTLYVLNTVAVTGIVPREALLCNIMPYGLVLNSFLGPLGEQLMAVFMIIVCVGAMNAWVLAMGQVAKGAAEDGFFPAVFKKVNKDGAPVWGIGLSAALLFVCLLFLASEQLAAQIKLVIDVSVVASVFIYGLCAWVYLRLLGRQGGSVLAWFAALGSLGFCALISFGLTAGLVLLALLIPLSGVPFDWWWHHRTAKRAT
jgi:APA family basic amino acid/polyamine antiporter